MGRVIRGDKHYSVKALTIIIPIGIKPIPVISDRIIDPNVSFSLFLYEFIEDLIKITPTTIITTPKTAKGISIYVDFFIVSAGFSERNPAWLQVGD